MRPLLLTPNIPSLPPSLPPNQPTQVLGARSHPCRVLLPRQGDAPHRGVVLRARGQTPASMGAHARASLLPARKLVRAALGCARAAAHQPRARSRRETGRQPLKRGAASTRCTSPPTSCLVVVHKRRVEEVEGRRRPVPSSVHRARAARRDDELSQAPAPTAVGPSSYRIREPVAALREDVSTARKPSQASQAKQPLTPSLPPPSPVRAGRADDG